MSDYPPLGRFVTQRLNAEKRDVAKSHYPEYSGIYAAVGRAVVAKYPGLTEFKRRVVFATLKTDAIFMTRRTNRDQTRTLPEVQSILSAR